MKAFISREGITNANGVYFYANILNLILFLAQIEDYDNIQRLSYAAGIYFRFLLGEKGTFVKLSDELKCVQAYIDVQHMRSFSSKVPLIGQAFISKNESPD